MNKSATKNLLAVAALGLSLGLGTSAHATPRITAQSIIVNPVQTDLQVKVWTNKANNTAQVPNYTPGERIRLFTQVNQDAYVYLFNVDPNGQVDLILPNRYAGGANFVKANTVKAFPGSGDSFTFDIAAPYGLNKVLALASLTPLNLDQIASFKGSQDKFATVNVQGQQQLAQALSIVVNPVAQPVPQNSWISAVTYYNVAQGYNTTRPAPVYPAPVYPAPRPAPIRPVTVYPSPVQQNPEWLSRPNWQYQLVAPQQNTAQVYIQYANELQRHGYRLVRRYDRGNLVGGRFVNDNNESAELMIRVGNGAFNIQIVRR